MKKATLLLSIVFLALISCSVDNNCTAPVTSIVTNSGFFKHEGVTYPANRGYLIPVYSGNDPSKEAYKHLFYLGFSDGTLTWDNNYFVLGNDVHQWIDFSLDTSTAHLGTMNDTSFTFSSEDDLDSDAARINGANIIYNIVAENGELVEYTHHDSNQMMATGGLHLTLLGNGVYKINYEFVDDDGDNVTGSYVGTLTTLYYPWL